LIYAYILSLFFFSLILFFIFYSLYVFLFLFAFFFFFRPLVGGDVGPPGCGSAQPDRSA
jgi:hypothetical protein